MSRVLRHLNSYRSKGHSSFQSSNSLGLFDEESRNYDSRVPSEIKTLSTGLQLVLDEQFVENVWNSERQKEILQDLLVIF